MKEFALAPTPKDGRLTEQVGGIDQNGDPVDTRVVVEQPLTLYLNGQEIVTMMTVGDHPDCLAVGYLLNQSMLAPDDRLTGIDYDEELSVVVVRTERITDFEEKLQKKTLTSGCAQGTAFGDLMEHFDEIELDRDAVHKVLWHRCALEAFPKLEAQVLRVDLKDGALIQVVLAQEYLIEGIAAIRRVLTALFQALADEARVHKHVTDANHEVVS